MKNSKNSKITQQSDKNRGKKRKIILSLLIVFIVLPISAALIALAGFAIYTASVKVDASLLPTASAVPTFYDRYGEKVSYSEDSFLSPNEIPDNLKYAFIATEDKRFYKHKGYDAIRIGSAILKDIKAGKAVEGASTITQQLVKNTHLSQDRTLKRKLKEIALAINLENEYSKDEILSMYLSVIYFGNGIYGVKQAAKNYFAKDIQDLNVAECATLAAIVKNPSKYSPNKNADASFARRNLIIDNMCEQNYIALDTANMAKSMPITHSLDSDDSMSAKLVDKDIKIYFDNVVQEVCKRLDITKYQLYNSGYKIFTNYDENLQRIAHAKVKDENGRENDTDAIVLLIDNMSGAVLAYSSTLGYNPKRQIGSTIKPILYSAAIDKGIINLATPVIDEQIDYFGFSPTNYGDKYYGNTLIVDAIKKSMNSVAVKTCDFVGIDSYFDYVKRFGLNVSEQDKNYALSLGATENGISPLELACAYTVFPSNGEFKTSSFVRFVEKDGEKVLSNDNIDTVQVIKPSTAQLMTYALEQTVKDGTAKALSALPFDIAAKTGTVERKEGNNSDAWCVSFNSDYTLLVWHGSDAGMQEKGGGHPAKQSAEIWHKLHDLKESNSKYSESFESGFDKSEIVACDVDLFSTFNSKTTVLASENTPLEYRKTMYSAVDNTPDTDNSYFDGIVDTNWTVESFARGFKVKFDREKIYDYDVYRKDIFGERLIKHFDSVSIEFGGDYNALVDNAREPVQVTDHPWSFGTPVTYTLITYLKSNPDIKNVSTKTVFVDTRY